MPHDIALKHMIPQIGFQCIPLYPPADYVYTELREQNEERRLTKLRHLGSPSTSGALPGTRQARWDYTIALLHYPTKLNLPSMNNKIRIGSINFSSTNAALQCAALVWNTGHLPGTFSVEKGIWRFLYDRNKDNPVAGLHWHHDTLEVVRRMQDEANRLLNSEDYLSVARVLAVIKLLSYCSKPEGTFFQFVCSFAAPFLLGYNEGHSAQWAKINSAFGVVRHLAYLTLDAPFSGLPWFPSIPAIVEHQINNNLRGLEEFISNVSEILSPIERLTFDSVYHSNASRKEASAVADHIFKLLHTKADPATVIDKWLTCGLFRELKLGRRTPTESLEFVASIKLRSHFTNLNDSPVDMEKSLQNKKFSHPAVFRYKAWNSETMLEPDQLIVDAITNNDLTVNDVGRLTAWFVSHFENLDAQANDTYNILKKGELETAYLSLVRRAIEIAYPSIEVRLEPWNLTRFGLFKQSTPMESKGGIWATTAKLDDPIIKHILRNRYKSIPTQLRDQYAELLGIRELRKWLRKRWKQKDLHQRWIVLTGSIRFYRGTRALIEFDGGLMKISTRSGKMTWYGLESKRGRTDPLHSLNRRLKVIGLNAPAYQLSPRYAFVELPLTVPAK
ncbi:MAG: hypothetical protein ABIJ37_07935 [Pseudomonadota bacterium]